MFSVLSYLDVFRARAEVQIAVLRLEGGLDWVKEKRPDKPEVWKPYEQSIEGLRLAQFVYDQVEKEYRTAHQRNQNLEMILIEKEREIYELRKQNENLKAGL